MPASVKQLGGAIKHEDTIEICWRFKANLWDLPAEGLVLDAPGPVPLPGSWQLKIYNPKSYLEYVGVVVQYGDLPAEALGTSVAVKIEFSVEDYSTQRLASQTWDRGPAPKRTSATNASCRPYSMSVSLSSIGSRGDVLKYICSVTLARNLQCDNAPVYHTPTADATKAQRLAGESLPKSRTLHARHSDICLRFRRRDTTDLDLWTTSGLLATASDYYKTLLASDCVETVPSGSKRKRREVPPVPRQISPAQPSIDGCTSANHNLTEPEYQQIDVRETAYSTMSAVLLYLMTGHIDFAPLNSLLVARDQGEDGARRALLDKHASEHPTLPPPVSPKSVYRLAHLLQRGELQRLALDSLSTSLTDKGAASELFGPVSIAYTDVRQTILDYVVKNWAKVQATESWKEWRGKVAADEVPGGAAILADLLGALYEGKS